MIVRAAAVAAPLPPRRWPMVNPDQPVTREEAERAALKYKRMVAAAQQHPDVLHWREHAVGQFREHFTPEAVAKSPPVLALFEEGWVVAGLHDIYSYAVTRQRRVAKRLGPCLGVGPVPARFPVGESRVVYGYWPDTERQKKWEQRKEDRDRAKRERRTGQGEFRFRRPT